MQLERDVETYLRDEVKKRGGRCIKLSSQFEEGLPDRLVLLPGEVAFFVETKRIKGVLRAMQKLQHKRLRKLGFRVYVPCTKKAVDTLLEGEVMPNEIQASRLSGVCD